MLSVSVVVHKTPPEKLRRALNSLLNSPVDIIYVVDNSPSETLKTVSEIDPRIQYLHVPNNGYGAANNIAIKKAMEQDSDYHLVMNPDVWWNEESLSSLLKALEEDPSIGLIAPQILNPDGSIQYSCRELPGPLSLIKNRLFPSRKTEHLQPPVNQSFYLLGAFLLFRIEALRDIGLFDERFFLYPEDIDISRRMQKKWKVVYDPRVNVFHEHNRASAKSLRMFMIHVVNMVRYYRKWGLR